MIEAGFSTVNPETGEIIDSVIGLGAAGDITIDAESVELNGGGIGSAITTLTLGDGQGGRIRIDTDHLVMTQSASISSNSGISDLRTTLSGIGGAGGITITASTVDLSDRSLIQALTLGDGSGGDIMLTVDRLDLANNSQIGSASIFSDRGIPVSGDGPAGNITIMASDSIHIAGSRSGIISETGGRGDAGRLTIKSRQITLEDESLISADTAGTGRAGNIQIEVDRLTIQGGAQLRSRSGIEVPSRSDSEEKGAFFPGTGASGTIQLTAKQLILDTGGQITIATASDGSGGDMTIHAETLSLKGGAQISSDSGIRVDGRDELFVGTGRGGTITILVTDTLDIEGTESGVVANTLGAGRGGDISLHARRVQLRKQASIEARSNSTGNAGGIRIAATESFVSTNATVTTEASQADGGDIAVSSQSITRLRNSQITTTVGGGEGSGGNITITPEVIVLENSQIIAKAVEGRGGRIDINADALVRDFTSEVSASSELGIDGVVTIQALTNLSESLSPLPQRFAVASAIFRETCQPRLRTGHVSSLVERGRDGVALHPDGVLPRRLLTIGQSPSGVASAAILRLRMEGNTLADRMAPYLVTNCQQR